ncbi:MAG: acyltransferase [Undibacterium sp.]|nr:acyltransferase [Opitutaceae bacterium]
MNVTPIEPQSSRPTPPTDSVTANFYDVLRIFLAASVLYSHTFLLGGYGPEPFYTWSKHQIIAGELAVLGFFGLSGFLVTASYTRSSGVFDYLAKRVRRIVPGFWVCLVVTAFVLAPASFALRHGSLATFPWIGGHDSALQYVAGNLAIKIHQWEILGVLSGAHYVGSLNGSLWSLWPETLCYIILATIGTARLLDLNRALLLIGVGFLFVLHAARTLLPGLNFPLLPTWLILADQAPFFLAYFVGASLWLWRDRFDSNWPAALLLLLICSVLARLGGLRLLAPVLIPLLLVVLGRCTALRLRHDLSFGLYIYGFPVQQLLAATPVTRLPWPVFLVASLAATLVCAWLSWRFVERPFLRRSPSRV